MYCSKCGSELKEDENFCSKCGKKVKKDNKKLIYIAIGIIIVLLIIAIVVFTTKISNNDINTNVNETEIIDENASKDNSSIDKNVFNEIDFEVFKDKLRKVWFAEALEYDSIMEMDKSLHGSDYSEWTTGTSADGYPSEELRTIYTTSGRIEGPYVTAKSVCIFYNKEKTKVTGFSIFINDSYLGKMGRSKEFEYMQEVIDCFPYDFSSIVYERIENNQSYGNDFNILYQGQTIDNYLYKILSVYINNNEQTDEALNTDNTVESTNDISTTDSSVSDNEQTNNFQPQAQNTNANTNTSTTNNNTKKEMVEVPWFSYLGEPLEYYTNKLKEAGISYKVEKKQDLDYSNGTVRDIEHNGEKIEKGTTITITVIDNSDYVYDMEVWVNTGYLLDLVGLSYTYEEKDKVNLSVRINDVEICNGEFKRESYSTSPIQVGNYKGKKDNLKFDITIEGKKVTQTVHYIIKDTLYGDKPAIVIYKGGDMGPLG